MSTALTEAKMAIVETLKADTAIIAEFTAANVDYGEPRNLNMDTVVKRINVVSVGEVTEAYAVLSARSSNVTFAFDIVVSFLEADPKAASDRWEKYDGMIKNALDANPYLIRATVKRAALGITFPRSLVVNNPQTDYLYHAIIAVEARHRVVAGARG